MTDLSDVKMDGVKPMGDSQELGIGKYLVRIEGTEKKETKEKFDDNGYKLPPNHYLQFDLRVYGGPSDGQNDFERLNLWNANATAVNIAKSQLKSIQNATGVFSPSSLDFHGHWMILEVKANTKGQNGKHYSAAPLDMIPTDVPPVVAPQQQAAQRQAPAQQAAQQTTQHPAQPQVAQAATNAVPDWAKRK